ncbi:LOW QUALITY PROTEIN: HNT2 Bis(5'-adenosyl)-triphosphatase [Candida maltosa Xu316]
MTTSEIYFYKYLVTKQVFYKSKYTYALVNLKPLVRVMYWLFHYASLRFGDLSPEESLDYMKTLQLVHKFIQKTYNADSLNIAIQDGPESGQSVPHLHTHIIPRFKNDGYGDSMYTKLDVKDLDQEYRDFYKRKEVYRLQKNELAKKDEDRTERTEEVMAMEAKWLAEELEKFI